MVAFTAMGEGTTGTPLHKGSEAQSVGAVQTPHQTEESICAYACMRVCVCVCVCRVYMHGFMWVYGCVFNDKLSDKVWAGKRWVDVKPMKLLRLDWPFSDVWHGHMHHICPISWGFLKNVLFFWMWFILNHKCEELQNESDSSYIFNLCNAVLGPRKQMA